MHACIIVWSMLTCPPFFTPGTARPALKPDQPMAVVVAVQTSTSKVLPMYGAQQFFILVQ